MTAAPVLTAPSIRRRPRPEPARRTVPRRRVDGTVIDAVVLDPGIFGVVPNTSLLHQVITAQLAAARSGTQSTRTRAEVRGGGAKPFRQKGTGRARQGSIRSPQWTGGGVALGPKPRSYRQRTPKKMIRLALHSALSDRAGENKVALVDEWSFPAPKTKDAIAALSALGLDGKVLVVLGPDDGIPDRSFANLPDVRTIQSVELNAYDVMRSDWVVFTDTTLPGESASGSLDDVAHIPGPSDEPVEPARASRPAARRRTRSARKSADAATAADTATATDADADADAAADTAAKSTGAAKSTTARKSTRSTKAAGARKSAAEDTTDSETITDSETTESAGPEAEAAPAVEDASAGPHDEEEGAP